MDDKLPSSQPGFQSPEESRSTVPASPPRTGVYERPDAVGAQRRRRSIGLAVGALILIAILVALFVF